MSKILRIGIIGAGGIARFAHIPAYKRNAACKLGAISDIDEKARKEALKKFNIAHVYKVALEMIDREELDAVSICTPPNTHAELVLECARKHIHILCEKPFALSTDEAERMVTECRKNNVILAVAYMLRFDPNLVQIKKRLIQGKLGRLRSVISVYHRPPPTKKWYFEPEISGGGVIMDLGSHLIDLHNWFVDDEVESLSVFAHSYGRMNVENMASIVLKYKNGITTMMSLSWLAPRETVEHLVVGSACIDKANSFMPIRYRHTSYKAFIRELIRNIPALFPPPRSNPWQSEIDDFIDSIIHKRRPRATGLDGLKVTRIVERLYQLKDNWPKD